MTMMTTARDSLSKSPTAYRTISEVSGDLDVPQHVLRFWESKFSQIRPLKRGGGRRYYRPEDVDLLGRIRHLLYADGYTIKGVQRLMREGALKAKRDAHGDTAHGEGHDEPAHAEVSHDTSHGASHSDAGRAAHAGDGGRAASAGAAPASAAKTAMGGVLDVGSRAELKDLLSELLTLREDLRRLAG